MTRRHLTALVVVAVGAVVAVTATGVSLFLPSTDPGRWTIAVRVAGGAAAAAGLAVLLAWRGPSRSARDHAEDPTIAALAAAATIMVVLALLAALAPRLRVEDDGTGAVASGSRIEAPRRPRSDRPASPPSDLQFGLGAVRAGEDTRPTETLEPQAEERDPYAAIRSAARYLLLGLLLLAMLVIAIRAFRRRLALGRYAALGAPVDEAEAAAGLRASLHEVAYDGPDPRRQITAAYLRLLAALAEAGAPRRPHEAPHEHLHRALGPLGVPPAPMHRLAELYVIAQFTERTITDRHRSAAAEALGMALDALGGRRAQPMGGSVAR